MNLLLVVVEHPAGYIACLHSQDDRFHQVAGSLEDQVLFRQQSSRRQAKAIDISIKVISINQVAFEDADHEMVFRLYQSFTLTFYEDGDQDLI